MPQIERLTPCLPEMLQMKKLDIAALERTTAG